MTQTHLPAAHPALAVALPHVDLGAGIENLIGFVTGGIRSGIVAAENASIPQVSALPGGGGRFFGTVANGQAAIRKIAEIVADARRGDAREGVADGVDLLKLVFATLDTYRIDVPVLTQIIADFPGLHAGGVDATV